MSIDIDYLILHTSQGIDLAVPVLTSLVKFYTTAILQFLYKYVQVTDNNTGTTSERQHLHLCPGLLVHLAVAFQLQCLPSSL